MIRPDNALPRPVWALLVLGAVSFVTAVVLTQFAGWWISVALAAVIT